MAGAESPETSDSDVDRGWKLLYDADCSFCLSLLSLVVRWDRDGRLQPIALQSGAADELLSDLTPQQRLASWHLLSPHGERWSAGAAFAPLLRLLPAGRAPAAVAARFPGLADRGYAFVAGHRSTFSKLVRRVGVLGGRKPWPHRR
jgi:predicted DCC family thiol-disulfide oxidoreductase YuxK